METDVSVSSGESTSGPGTDGVGGGRGCTGRHGRNDYPPPPCPRGEEDRYGREKVTQKWERKGDSRRVIVNPPDFGENRSFREKGPGPGSTGRRWEVGSSEGLDRFGVTEWKGDGTWEGQGQ